MKQSLSELFKDIYCSDDPLDEDHSLTYHMDPINTTHCANKKLKRYKVTLIKYGLTHGGSYESSWGHPSTIEMHEEELFKIQNNSSYKILDLIPLSIEWHHKIIGKETPEGIYHPTKREYPWCLGKSKRVLHPYRFILTKK